MYKVREVIEHTKKLYMITRNIIYLGGSQDPHLHYQFSKGLINKKQQVNLLHS